MFPAEAAQPVVGHSTGKHQTTEVLTQEAVHTVKEWDLQTDNEYVQVVQTYLQRANGGLNLRSVVGPTASGEGQGCLQDAKGGAASQ